MLSWLVLCHCQKLCCSRRVKTGCVATSVFMEQCREEIWYSAFVRLLLMFVFLTEQNCSFLLPLHHVLIFLNLSFPRKEKGENGFEIWFTLNITLYEKWMLSSHARVIERITVCYLFLCFHAGDLWLWSVSLEAGASCYRSDLFWWLSPPPPLLDAWVACKSNMQKDYA